MKRSPSLDDHPFEAALDDGDVQAMARRQLGVSLVVAFVFLALAGLMMVRAPYEAPVEMAAQHKIMIVRPEAPRMEIAQPTQAATTRG